MMDLRAVIFVPVLAGCAIMGFVFLMFTANYFLTILESSGVGARHVTWYSEPILENAWKVAYLGWLAGLWLGPAYLINRALTAGVDSVWVKLAIPLFVVWLCYPISQLSSLSGNTIWMPLVPDVFARFAQRPLITLGFLGLSLLDLAVFAVGFKWAFLTEGEWQLLFIGAPVVVLTGFLYARLLGRLAFALRFTRGLFEPRKKKKPKPKRKPADGTDAQSATDGPPEPRFTQPSELPPIQTPDEGELSGYEVTFEGKPALAPKKKKRVKAEAIEPEPERVETPKDDPGTAGVPQADFNPPPRRKRKPSPASALERSREWTAEDDEGATAYGVHEAEVNTEDSTPKEVVRPLEEEMRLIRRDDEPKRSQKVWNPDLLAFLAQPGTIAALLVASSLCVAAGALVRVARIFNPMAGAGPD